MFIELLVFKTFWKSLANPRLPVRNQLVGLGNDPGESRAGI